MRCEAHDRQGLEQRCRYITRPAISNERLSINHRGQVVLKLKTAWRIGASRMRKTRAGFTAGGGVLCTLREEGAQ